jgi:hypothetical protein
VKDIPSDDKFVIHKYFLYLVVEVRPKNQSHVKVDCGVFEALVPVLLQTLESSK